MRCVLGFFFGFVNWDGGFGIYDLLERIRCMSTYQYDFWVEVSNCMSFISKSCAEASGIRQEPGFISGKIFNT